MNICIPTSNYEETNAPWDIDFPPLPAEFVFLICTNINHCISMIITNHSVDYLAYSSKLENKILGIKAAIYITFNKWVTILPSHVQCLIFMNKLSEAISFIAQMITFIWLIYWSIRSQYLYNSCQWWWKEL